LNGFKQYLIETLDYEATNADAISTNFGKVGEIIEEAHKNSRKSRIYSVKTNVIGHSMGGLLTKEYCRMNRSDCMKKINKFISIDTPHKGSELAGEVGKINTDKTLGCYNLLSELENKNKKIWDDKQSKTKLAGALVDLQIESDAMKLLNNSVLPFTWTAIAATTGDSIRAYDDDISTLWKWLRILCRKVPDSSFSTLTGWLTTAFNEPNDRVVSRSSQLGDAPESFHVPEADHSSVINKQLTLDKVKYILDK
jgi:pimeloyl-ACP methyl ester carboxylesterase